jgi:Domain of unknown function (DUF2017)
MSARFPATHARLIAGLFGELITLLDAEQDPAPAGSTDPLAVELGLTDLGLAELDPARPAPSPPKDPALARLLPDAYREDPAAAAEFRRYTEPELRADKRRKAETVLDCLARIPNGGKLTLSAAEAQSWLTGLNDLRLILGTRLGIVEDDQELPQSDDPDDPRTYLISVYYYLSYLQESLIGGLAKF